jgi:hypothetical protein
VAEPTRAEAAEAAKAEEEELWADVMEGMTCDEVEVDP